MGVMRWLVLIMLASGVAQADSKAEVEALIGNNLAAVKANDWKAFDNTFRSDGYYFLPNSFEKLVDQFYSVHTISLTQKIERSTVVVDDKTHVAWFHVEFSGHYKLAMGGPNEPSPWFDDRIRMIGVAID